MLHSVWVSSAVGFISGVLTAYFHADISPELYIALTLTTFVLFFILRNFRLSLLAILVTFITSNTYFQHSTNTKDSSMHSYINKYTNITAVICETPYFKNNLYHFTVEARKIQFSDNTPISVEERMKVTSETSFNFGETIVFRGFIKEYQAEANPLRFNSRMYHENRDIHFRMYATYAEPAAEQIKLKSSSFYIASARNRICAEINKRESGDKAALMCAVLAGNKNYFSEEFDNTLLKSGTRRYLYSARIHFILLAALVAFLTKRLKKTVKDILFVSVFVFYAFINSTNPIFMKVFLLSAAGIVYLQIAGLNSFSDILSITILICGFSNPSIIFDVGFQMSVCSTIIMNIFYNWLYTKFKLWLPHFKILRIVAVWIIMIVGLTPLSAMLFNSITPYSLLVSGVYVICIGATAIISPLYFFINNAFTHTLMNIPVQIMLRLPDLLIRLPFSYMLLPRPSALFMFMYYTWLLAFRYSEVRKLLIRIGLGFTLAYTAVQVMRYNTVDIHFIDVGQGDAQIIEMPYRQTLLIDGGGSTEYTDYDVGQYEYLPYLLSEGITHADAAFVSHYHSDHAEGIITAIENIKVDTLYLPDCDPSNEYRIELENAALKHNTKITYINKDKTLHIGDAKLKIYAARCADDEDINNHSLVMKFEYGNFNALFTGDITSKAESVYINEKIDLRASILKIPHHGSKYSSSDEFIKAVSPVIAIAGAGEENQYDFPTDEVIDRLTNNNVKILCTGKQSDIIVTGTKNGIKAVKHH